MLTADLMMRTINKRSIFIHYLLFNLCSWLYFLVGAQVKLSVDQLCHARYMLWFMCKPHNLIEKTLGRFVCVGQIALAVSSFFGREASQAQRTRIDGRTSPAMQAALFTITRKAKDSRVPGWKYMHIYWSNDEGRRKKLGTKLNDAEVSWRVS